MSGNAVCTGQLSCMSFGVIIILLFMAVFFNYIVRCLHSSSPRARHPSDLPVTNGGGAPDGGGGIVPDRPLLSVNSPLYRHAIGSIPVVAYGASNGNGKSSSSRDSFERENCAICLAEFEERDKVRILTKCKHVYHVECIDQWLRRSLCCPVCRGTVVDQQIHAKILSDYHQQQQLGAVAISNNDNNNVNDLSPSLVVNIGNGHANVYI